MLNNKSIQRYVDDIVSDYKVWNKDTEQYEVDLATVNEVDLRHFVALIVESDKQFANEAIGDDNSEFQSKMIPALVELLRMDDLSALIRFRKAWHFGLLKYFGSYMQGMVDEQLEKYNADRKAK